MADYEEENRKVSQAEFSIRMIEELSGIRGDIRELMATMKHFEQKMDRANEDIKEVKALANQASETAESAEEKANRALITIEDHKEDIERLFEKHREGENQMRINRRWAISTAVPFLGIVVTILLAVIFG